MNVSIGIGNTRERIVVHFYFVDWSGNRSSGSSGGNSNDHMRNYRRSKYKEVLLLPRASAKIIRRVIKRKRRNLPSTLRNFIGGRGTVNDTKTVSLMKRTERTIYAGAGIANE